MSFALTTEQYRNRTKTVTRRDGWWFLRPGHIVCGCVKCMGLKPGEKIVRLGMIRILSCATRPEDGEPLRRLIDDLDYGFSETTKEGFPEGHPKHWPSVFAEMFIANMGGDLDKPRNRIEFEYLLSSEDDTV